MSKEELLKELERLRLKSEKGDTETAHAEADAALLNFIQDRDVTTAYRLIRKWYS